MRAVIYKRVSSEGQIDGYSLDDQESDCRAYAAARQWVIVEVYADEGISGRNEDRPALQRMIAAARQRRFDVVLVYKLDRFARKARVQLQTAEELERLGVRIVSVTEQMDFYTSAGRFSLSMLAGAAQFYSDQLGERVQGALEYKASQGGWIGPVPVGYEKDADGRLVPSGDAFAVQRCFYLYATGEHSYGSVADALNALGYRIPNVQTKTRSRFSDFAVRDILQNPVYRGLVRLNGREYAGKHEALVDQRTWDSVHVIRRERGAKRGRFSVRSQTAAGDAPGDTTGKSLTEISYCAVCGARTWLHASGTQARGYYVCSGRSRRSCDAPGVRADSVEVQIVAVLRTLALPSSWQRRVLRRAERLLAQTVPSPELDHAALRDQLERLTDVYLARRIDRARYQRETARLEALLASEPARPALPDLQEAALLLRDLPALYAAGTLPERRALLRTIFARLWIERHRVTAITPTGLYLPLLAAASEHAVDGEPGGSPAHHLRQLPVPVPPIWTAWRVPWRAAA